jgi:hypothetical protein
MPTISRPKKNIYKILFNFVLPILLITILSYPALRDLIKPGYFTSHDGEGHIIRMQEFYQAFKDGQFPVRWSQRLYYGYGYPFFNFNYPAVYYLGLPTMLLGGSAILAMEIELGVTFILSGILMFLYLRRKMQIPWAVLGGIIYMYAPYRLLNLYVRGSVAESATFIFTPLILWVIEAMTQNKKLSLPLGALIIGFLGISHNITALLLFAFYWGYCLFQSIAHKSVKVWLKYILSFGLGILMASFFLVPALTEKGLTFLDTTIAKDYPDHFLYPVQLIQSGWDYGASIAGPNDGLSFNLGWLHLVLSLFSIFVLLIVGKEIKHKSLKLTYFYSLFIVLIAIFFMFPPSKFLWDNLPLLPFVQFPWRFIMLTVPTLTILAVTGLELISLSFKWPQWLQAGAAAGLIGLAIFLSRNHWFLNQPLFWENPKTDALAGTTTWADEQATQWLQPKPTSVPDQRIEFLNAGVDGIIRIQDWKTHRHQYEIEVDQTTTLVEHTMYYPGWKAWIDDEPVAINYQHQQYPGEIVLPIPAGQHTIVTQMTETPIRKTVDLVSGATLLLVLGWLGYGLVTEYF